MDALRPGDSLNLEVRSEPSRLGLVRQVVRAFAGRAGLDAARVEDLVAAVDESCSNVIRHAYAGRGGGLLGVACTLELEALDSRRVVVRVLDQGAPLPADCLAARAHPPQPPADISSLAPGGLGLRLIHGLVDEVALESSPAAGNVLRLAIACPSGLARGAAGNDCG